MRRDEAMEKLRALLPELRERFGVKELSIFGSTARDEAADKSDIDVLVEFGETPGFLSFMGLNLYLEDTLGVKVDLVTRDALKPRIAPRILQEAVRVA